MTDTTQTNPTTTNKPPLTPYLIHVLVQAGVLTLHRPEGESPKLDENQLKVLKEVVGRPVNQRPVATSAA